MIEAFSTKLKFIYSEKASKFCEISTLLLSYVVPVDISQNFVAFSEYMNFTTQCCNSNGKVDTKLQIQLTHRKLILSGLVYPISAALIYSAAKKHRKKATMVFSVTQLDLNTEQVLFYPIFFFQRRKALNLLLDICFK